MKKITTICLLLLSGVVLSQAPKKTSKSVPLQRPKLVVGIVVDQMRYDYLYRFYDKYSEGGFKKLMNEGFNCRNNHYHYAATYTGPGHAQIFNGSSPSLSGIVGNDWYDKSWGRMRYCTEDTTERAVGNNSVAGKMSPRNMWVDNICDQLKIASIGRSKVVGVALKDRGAILPAGHAANAAYWFDSKDGNWISSTYYMTQLPQWAQDFNARKLPAQYAQQTWEPLLPLEQYTESTIDDAPFENVLQGETKPVFPHSFVAAMGNKFEELRTSPFGDQLTKEMALAALKGENMGRGKETDFLCVSFSSPDYIGHRFGPQSVEAQDEFLRLDKVMAEMLTALDAQVGKGNYLVFLSADHGVAETPGFERSLKIPASNYEYGELVNASVEAALDTAFGQARWLQAYYNQEIYLNPKALTEQKVTIAAAFEVVKAALLKKKGILNVVNFHHLEQSVLPLGVLDMIRNVYHPQRSGDFYVLFEPNLLEGYRKGGSSHGTTYAYDTHVPLLFYGWGIKAGQTLGRTHIHDIAPTVAALLKILEPNGCVGNPIEAVFK